MRPRQLVLATVVALACLAGALPGAAGASGQRAPTLARHTVLTGSRMASVDIRLPRTITIGLTGRDLSRMIDIEGNGRASGFLLEGHDFDHPDGWPLFGFWNMAFCATSRCEQHPRRDFPFGNLIASGRVDDEDAPTQLRLPAGDYSLHVIADGSPVRVELRLPGLTGRRSFHPLRPEGPGILDTTVRVDVAPGRVAYSHGIETELHGLEAVAVTGVRLREDASVLKAVGHCLYQQPLPPEPVAFAPGCPGGTNLLAGGPIVSPFPTDFAFVGYFASPSEHLRGFGSWAVTAGVVSAIDAIAFVIDLGPDRSAGGLEASADDMIHRTFARSL